MSARAWIGAALLLAGAWLALQTLPPAPVPYASPAAVSSGEVIPVSALPRQARETLALIRRGGPFPYARDGAVFHNRERRLPARSRGYYTEYTVRTPRSPDRGPRRIVAGRGSSGDPASSGEYYYSADHYETFQRIQE